MLRLLLLLLHPLLPPLPLLPLLLYPSWFLNGVERPKAHQPVRSCSCGEMRHW